MTEQKLMTLMASFDINQIRPRIDWDFVEADVPDAQATDSWGNNIKFIPGQQFRIDLIVTNIAKRPLQAITVVDCCLITRPQIQTSGPGKPPKFAPPSPFVTAAGARLGALVAIPGSAFTQVSRGTPQVLVWDSHLVVGQVQSHWDLAFYVTVKLQWEQGAEADYRVFYFDPESEVGNGIDPP